MQLHLNRCATTSCVQQAACKKEGIWERKMKEKIHADMSAQKPSRPNIRTNAKRTQTYKWAAANTSDMANKASCWDKLFANKETVNTVICTNPQCHALSRTAQTDDDKNSGELQCCLSGALLRIWTFLFILEIFVSILKSQTPMEIKNKRLNDDKWFYHPEPITKQ